MTKIEWGYVGSALNSREFREVDPEFFGNCVVSSVGTAAYRNVDTPETFVCGVLRAAGERGECTRNAGTGVKVRSMGMMATPPYIFYKEPPKVPKNKKKCRLQIKPSPVSLFQPQVGVPDFSPMPESHSGKQTIS